MLVAANLAEMPGRLYLCSTPIGNLADASPRLAATLADVDLVYAEDTRRSGNLLNALGVSNELRSFFVGNERARSDDLAADLVEGRTVAVITDAGTPSVSDPGAAAVAVARRVGAEVVVVPGPSAVTAAVAGSGMIEGPFVFDGFLARKGRERSDQMAALAVERRPTVVFVTPHRFAADLADLAESLHPGRRVCVARELTKMHEELWWGTLAEARDRWQSQAARGELTLVIEGAPSPIPDPDDAETLGRSYLEQGLSRSQAARRAAAETGVDRRTIYDRLAR